MGGEWGYLEWGRVQGLWKVRGGLGRLVAVWDGSAEWVGGGRGGADLSEGFGPGGAKEAAQLRGSWQLGR